MKKSILAVFCFLLSIQLSVAQELEAKVDMGCEYLRVGRFQEAYKCFDEAASFGNAIAMYYMADCLANGYGVTKDDKAAFASFRRVAERGLPVAQARLAYILYKGVGTKKDVAKANYWMSKATNYEYIDAYTTYMLGLCYEEGLGRKADMQKAMECFQKSCSKNVDDAFVHTAWLFAEGSKVGKDFSQALSIINNAISNIGSAFDYACKGRIQQAMGDNQKARATWQTMIKQCPAYAVNGTDNFSMYMRGVSPVPRSVIQQLYAKSDLPVENTANKTSYNTISKKKDNEPHNNIVINYTTISQPEPTVAVRSNESVDQPQPEVASKSQLSDVDTNIPSMAQTNSETFAIVIANEHYQDVATVPYATHDGEVFASYCKGALGLPATNVHLVKDATLNNIRREINWLGQVTKAYRGDANIIFYYAGHGIPDETNHTAYILPIDGIGNDIATGYALDDLYSTLGNMQAKKVTVLLDACFSGTQRDGSMIASARGVAIKVKPNALQGNLVVFSAAQGDETAYPFKEQGHGMFTYYILKKLQETNGAATLGELSDYVTTQVERQSVVVNGKMQSPTINSASGVESNWKTWKLK